MRHCRSVCRAIANASDRSTVAVIVAVVVVVVVVVAGEDDLPRLVVVVRRLLGRLRRGGRPRRGGRGGATAEEGREVVTCHDVYDFLGATYFFMVEVVIDEYLCTLLSIA